MQRMYRAILAVLICCLFSRCADEQTIHFKNGWLWDGEQFLKLDFSIQDGLIKMTDYKGDQQIDLQGKYVIPPFADAHTHSFDDLDTFDSIYQAYIAEGTFYVQVLNNHFSHYEAIKSYLNRHGKIKAKFAHGGVTSSGGHPHILYESSALGYSWRAIFDSTKREAVYASRIKQGDAYFLIDKPEDIDIVWHQIISRNPDLLKVYLSNINQQPSLQVEGKLGTYGLSHNVAERIISLAKRESITVYAHIETPEDFHAALRMGIAHFAHMPGYGGGIGNMDTGKLKVPDSILAIAAQNNVVITPTVSFAKYYSMIWDGEKMTLDTTLWNEKKSFISSELRRYYDAGIHIALGADQSHSTLTEEIHDVAELGVFTNKELLKIVTGSVQLIFPERRIGKIQHNYPADFLVLHANPLNDFEAIKRIHLRVLDGMIIE